MDLANAAAAIAANEALLRAQNELTQTPKGQLQLGLSGAPVSITQDQIVFALAMKVTPEHPIEQFAAACAELRDEGAIAGYRLIHDTFPHPSPDGASLVATTLDTPVVIAVRRRSAESTRIGPAAL